MLLRLFKQIEIYNFYSLFFFVDNHIAYFNSSKDKRLSFFSSISCIISGNLNLMNRKNQ